MNIGTLTRREAEVLGLISKGKSTKEISYVLGISFKTVACHREKIMNKLGAVNAADMVARGVRAGLVNVEDAPPAMRDPLWELRVAEVCRNSQRERLNLSSVLQRYMALSRASKEICGLANEVRSESFRPASHFLEPSALAKNGNSEVGVSGSAESESAHLSLT